LRSPQELEAMRVVNRGVMGLSGFDPLFPARVAMGMRDATSTLLGAVGPITVGSAFPPFSYTYDPSQPAAQPTSTGGWLSTWITQSIVRPFANFGGTYVYNPGADAPDYSQVALAGSVALGGLVLVGIGWVLYRAFFGGRRSNPRPRVRYVYVPRPRVRYVRDKRAA
jgi:hypothetical protein